MNITSTYEVSGYLVRKFNDAQRTSTVLKRVLEDAELPVALAGSYIPGWVTVPATCATWILENEQGGETCVSSKMIAEHELQPGDHLKGRAQDGRMMGLTSYPSHEVSFLGDGAPPALFPSQRFRLATGENGVGEITRRAVDLVATVGKGGRILIIAPPGAGKTVLVRQIGFGILQNHPEAELWFLLVNERPEEVTAIERIDPVRPDLLPALTGPQVRIFATTFDVDNPLRCIRLAERVLAQAQQLVLGGRDIVVVIDSLTRLARAYNSVLGQGWDGGWDQGGVVPPAKLFAGRLYGLARALSEPCGSFTIIATAYTETGSKFDDAIRDEYKGRGNCEIRLSLKMAQAGIFPAMDIKESETRNHHLLFPKQWEQVDALREMLFKERGSEQPMKALLALIERTPSNEVLLNEIGGGVQRAAKEEAFQNFINAAGGIRSLSNKMGAFRAALGVVGFGPPEAVAQFVKSLSPDERAEVRSLLEKEGLVATANHAPPPPLSSRKKAEKPKAADTRPEAERLRDVGIPPELAGLPA